VIRGFAIYSCKTCGHRFVPLQRDHREHVEDVYSDTYFNGGGAGYVDYLAEEKILIERGRSYANWVAGIRRKKGLVLDVGSAAGFVLQGWIDAGWSGFGIEPNERMASLARSRGLDVLSGSLEMLASSLAPKLDCIAMIQVLSHLMNPLEAIQTAFNLLQPGGILVIETWDRRSWIARLQGKGWHEYSPPSVLHWFSKKSLRLVCEKVGFQHVVTQGVFRWIEAEHAKSLLAHAASQSALMKFAHCLSRCIPNRLNLPYPGDDLFRIALRKP